MDKFIVRLKEQWWPEIRDRESARKAAIQGFAGAILHVVVALGFAAVAAFRGSYFGVNAVTFIIAAALFGTIAFGMWRLSSVAAVAGLVLFLPALLWSVHDSRTLYDIVRSLILTLVLGSLFVNGVRGAFAYRRFMVGDPGSGPPRLNRREKEAL